MKPGESRPAAGRERRPIWSLRACLAAALATALLGLAGATLLPRRAADDAFRARLDEYRKIGEAMGRGPQARRDGEGSRRAP